LNKVGEKEGYYFDYDLIGVSNLRQRQPRRERPKIRDLFYESIEKGPDKGGRKTTREIELATSKQRWAGEVLQSLGVKPGAWGG